MTIKDILVQVDERPASLVRAKAAAAVAQQHQGSVCGVFLKSAFLNDYLAMDSWGYFPAESFALLAKEHGAAVEKASEVARLAFEGVAAEAGVASDWRVVDGETDHALLVLARRCDLSVFPATARVSLGTREISAARLGLASGGPVLVTPDDGREPTVGKRVLVAWNGSREAARALKDAWPLVRRDGAVEVLVVSPAGEGGPDGMLQRHLERHGFEGRVTVDRSHDTSAAQIIRGRVRELEADLVVMGLYGRSRLSELVLGGVSHDLLADPPTSILMSH